jgi:hypothetical protein
MTHQINPSILLSKKQIKFVLLIALLFGFINNSNSQTTSEKKGSLKTISYGEHEGDYDKEYDYVAIGYVNNNQFVENQILTFLTNRNKKQADTIVSGRCFYAEDGNSYIDGIWKKHEYEGRNKIKKIIRCKGVFKVSNNKNSIGITTNKKIGEEPIIKTISNTNYILEIIDPELKLETPINNLDEQEINSSFFEDYILKSKQVKLTIKNGDLFLGTVKRNTDYSYIPTEFVPNNGEYKYTTGEVSNGEIFYSNVFYKFLLYKGSIVFNDGSVDNDLWLEKYNFDYNVMAEMYRNSKSLNEIRNKAKSMGEEKGKELRENKILQEQLMEKIRQNKQKLKTKLIAKYGENIGNKISQGELEAGMSKSIVSDVWKEEYFTVSNIVRNSQNFEIWEFNSDKMATDLLKEYGKDAYNVYLGISLAEQFGKINIPKTLIFKNDKLTDIYR